MARTWDIIGTRALVGAVVAALCAGSGTARADELDDAIREHRMGVLVVEAPPGAAVKVEQVRHEFWFGAALSSSAFGGRMTAADAAQYKRVFLENFNAAVTENALKWHSMERERGNVNYAIADAMADWAAEHGIPIRGHNIYWGVEQFVPRWQIGLSDAELERVVRERAYDVGRRYRGRYTEYDLNNEMIHDNYYERRLGARITKRMADWVREADPDAQLWLNDYDILTGNELDRFVQHVRDLREQGVPIAGLGVQGHLHAETFDREALRDSLDELGELGLPIRITEFNMPGQRSSWYRQRSRRRDGGGGSAFTPEDERRKAQDLVDYYRICFAHPAVEGILMWGFWEGANWIPESSLYKRDWTPTPAAEAYRGLVFDQWWTRWEGTADASGRVRVPAFYGQHDVTVNGREERVELAKAAGEVVVRMR